MEYADFVEKCVKEYKETENEFVYQLIDPFCETVVEKKLSKEELTQILKKGMQKSIPLDRIKQAREEIKSISQEVPYRNQAFSYGISICETDNVLEILDKLIESEVDNG